MPSASATATDAELTAFAASFEEFVRAAKRARARVEPDATLTTSQYDLLCPLIEGDDARLGLRELARAAGVSAPTATRMVDGLAARGVVTREAGPPARGILPREPAPDDRRAVRIALTAEGRAAVLDRRAHQLDRRRALFDKLSPADRRAAAKVLARLAAAYEEID